MGRRRRWSPARERQCPRGRDGCRIPQRPRPNTSVSTPLRPTDSRSITRHRPREKGPPGGR
ncbi:hypothetical protein J004_03771 [Cryptococcus neoformans]|nr:hypothetical protein J004_03771 [Cryptococcus neoformans var. grubii]